MIKNTASQHIGFKQVSASTGAGSSGASVTVYISKDGGAQGTGGGSVTSLGNGQYDYAPTQAETNATEITFLFVSTGNIPEEKTVYTQVDVGSINGVSTSSVTTINANIGEVHAWVYDSNNYPGINVVDIAGSAASAAVAINANITEIGGQTVTCAAGVTVLASVGTASTSTAQTGDAYARLGAPAGASVSADIAAVKSSVGSPWQVGTKYACTLRFNGCDR